MCKESLFSKLCWRQSADSDNAIALDDCSEMPKILKSIYICNCTKGLEQMLNVTLQLSGFYKCMVLLDLMNREIIFQSWVMRKRIWPPWEILHVWIITFTNPKDDKLRGSSFWKLCLLRSIIWQGIVQIIFVSFCKGIYVKSLIICHNFLKLLFNILR